MSQQNLSTWLKKRKQDEEPEPSSMPSGSSDDVSAKRPRIQDEQEEQPVANLEALLDLTEINDQARLQERFDKIALTLLSEYYLVVTQPGKSTKLEIREFEFYLQKEGFHEDPFTHGSQEQAVAARWYFHRAPRRSENSNRSATSTSIWRDGSRKGLDLTIGRPFRDPSVPLADGSNNPPTLLRGGILLRTIGVVGAQTKLIQGPSLLVDEILSQSGANDIPDLVNTKWNGDMSAFPSESATNPPSYSLQLIPRERSSAKPVPTVYNSPRIGLDLSHPGTTGPKIRPLHSRIRFLLRTYRYFRDPHMLTVNGRSQTFIGVLLRCSKRLVDDKRKSKGAVAASTSTEVSDPPSKEELDQVLKNPRLLSDIIRISGIREQTAKKYLGDYVAGRKGGDAIIEGFIGAPGKGVSSSPANYLKLMGAMSMLDLGN